MSLILPAMSLLIWLYFLISGIDGYNYIAAQRVHLFPNSGQAIIYIVVPAAMSFGSAFGILLAWKNRYTLTLLYLSMLSIVAVMPYILVARGGV